MSSSSSATMLLRSSGEIWEEPDALACRTPAFPLIVDLMDWLSERSSCGDVRPVEELRGLSPDLLPGIFVRSAVLSDLDDSRVSDLLNEGYEARSGPGPVGVCEPGVLLPSFSLDG